MNVRTLAAPALGLLAVVAHCQSVPMGFTNEAVITSGLVQPCGIHVLTDGRILFVEKVTGNVRVHAAGQVATVGTVSQVVAHSDRGLCGITADPLWPQWPYVYVHYTHTSGTVRVTRFTCSGDLTGPASTNLTMSAPYDLITDGPDGHPHHNGGTLKFGPDGMLYVSLGDDQQVCLAQDPESLLGQILRLDVSSVRGATGSGPPAKSVIAAPGNPYSGPNSQLVWALGLRNPFRFSVDSVSGNLYVADVGSSQYEEVCEVSGPGQNFGWPLLEGPQAITTCPGATGPFLAPIIARPSTQGAALITFGGRYRNPVGGALAFGPAYEGDVFAADYVTGEVARYRFDGTSWAIAPAVTGQPTPDAWGTGFSGVTDAQIGPDGALYYVKINQGSGIYRIRPDTSQLTVASGNHQAGNAGTPLQAPLSVRLSDANGTPLAGMPVTFTVIDGDGLLAPQPVITDAAGIAATTFTPGTSPAVDPVIEATAPNAPSARFDVVWRGLTVSYIPFANFASIGVVHSETDSPITVTFDAPAATPFFSSMFGSVWTSLLAPLPTLGAFDGLGLLGPADPQYRTGPTTPTWSRVFMNLPPTGGLSMTIQAFAVDAARLPAGDAIMISQPIALTLN